MKSLRILAGLLVGLVLTAMTVSYSGAGSTPYGYRTEELDKMFDNRGSGPAGKIEVVPDGKPDLGRRHQDGRDVNPGGLRRPDRDDRRHDRRDRWDRDRRYDRRHDRWHERNDPSLRGC